MKRLRLPGSTAAGLDRELLRGISLVTTFAALAAAARVAQDVAISWRFGAGPVVDAYTYLVSLFALPGLLALSTLTLLMAPMEASGGTRRWRAELLGAALVLALLAWPLAAWLTEGWLGTGWAGLSSAAHAVALQSLGPLSLLTPLGLLGALFAAWLVAANRQLLSLAEGLAPLTLVVALLLAGSLPHLLWGTAIGLALQVLMLAWLLKQAQALPIPRLGLSEPPWRLFARGASAMLAGQALFALVPLVDPLFAAHLGEGALATQGYAARLVTGLMGLAGLAVQRVGLPLLTRATLDDARLARRTAFRWALLAALAGVALALVVAWAADPLVALLFERGRFGAQERGAVASLLRLGMLQLPFFLAGLALVVALAAASAHVALAWAAAAGLVVKLVASALLVPHWGVQGLMLSSAVMYAATAAMTAWALFTRRPWPAGGPKVSPGG